MYIKITWVEHSHICKTFNQSLEIIPLKSNDSLCFKWPSNYCRDIEIDCSPGRKQLSSVVS